MRPNPRLSPSIARPAVRTRQAGTVEHERVYAEIRDAITGHRLAPGSKLKEVPLSELFGVTRGVIRKALAGLAAVGLVQLRPNRGAIVACPGLEESRQIFAARRAIECALVELLAISRSVAALKRLKALIQKEQQAYDRSDKQIALKLSIEFHRELARLSGNAVMAEILERLVAQTPLVLLAWRDPQRPGNCVNIDHVRLIEAIEAGDAASARELMRCHLCDLEGQLRRPTVEPESELARIFAQSTGRSRRTRAH